MKKNRNVRFIGFIRISVLVMLQFESFKRPKNYFCAHLNLKKSELNGHVIHKY